MNYAILSNKGSFEEGSAGILKPVFFRGSGSLFSSVKTVWSVGYRRHCLPSRRLKLTAAVFFFGGAVFLEKETDTVCRDSKRLRESEKSIFQAVIHRRWAPFLPWPRSLIDPGLHRSFATRPISSLAMSFRGCLGISLDHQS